LHNATFAEIYLGRAEVILNKGILLAGFKPVFVGIDYATITYRGAI